MEVEIIKAKGAGEDTSTGRKIDRLRVAAYCRVSTDDEDQIKSYNSMVRYYTDLIKSNKQWVFAGVFADKAITGTKTDKREEFQLLIQECLSGNIDLVIAKSIPRFARNTLDTLKYVRMLRERNIAVYFEVEKINTLKDGEFLLTILSSVAQQEVENTSAYVKKGLKMKMKRGELVGFQGCLGYDYDVVTKSLSINEEGAETVRYIFDRYVAGAGSTMIARELNEQGISTVKGNPWTSSSVMGIINNEKYKGDILLGKTFTVDPISKRRLENLGEEDRFYIKNHHEPIVSEEKFARAQEIRERRNGGRKKGVAPGKREKFSRQYAFSCMLECGFCGANLSRRRWHSSSKYTKTIWQCVESTKHGKRFCPDSKGIPEQVIEDAFIESYRMLCTDHKDVLEEFIKRVEKTLSEDSIEDKIEKLNRSVYNIQYKRKKLLENYLEGVVAKDIYEETDVGYEKKLSETKAQLSMLEQQYDNEGSLQRRLADFRKALSKNQILEEFDRGIFESIIEKVIVGGYDENGEKDPYKIIFIYKTGFKNEIGNAKERFGKKSKAVEKAKEMCSHIVDGVKDVCSYVSDNTPHTGLKEYKNIYRPARVLHYDQETGDMVLHNYMNYVDLKDYIYLIYEVSVDGEVDCVGQIELDESIPAHEEKTIKLPVSIPDSGKCYLKVSYCLKNNTQILHSDESLGFDEILLKNIDGRNQKAIELLAEMNTDNSFTVEECDRYFTIHVGQENTYRFNRLTGLFESITVKGKELLTRPMELNIWRAPTDNDRKIKLEWMNAHYDQGYARAYETSCITQNGKLHILGTLSVSAPTVQKILDVKSEWIITSDGAIQVKMDVKRDLEFPMLPRFGIRLFLNRDFDNVEYYGIGPEESYVDKRRAGSHGKYDANVLEMHEDYLRPQENGSHTDCDYLILKGKENTFAAAGERTFSFNVSPYTQEELTAKRHSYELQPCGSTVVCLDYVQNGIGSNSCGPELSERYRLDAEQFNFEIKMIIK